MSVRTVYAIAVIDDFERAKSPNTPKGDGLRYVTKESLKVRRRDVRKGVEDHKLGLNLTRHVADTRLYSTEEGAWLEYYSLKFEHSALAVVKLRVSAHG